MEMPESNNIIQIKVENDDDESLYMAANGTNGSSSSLTPSPTSSSNNSFSPYPSVAAVASSTGQSVSSTQSYSGGGGGGGQVVSSIGSPQSTTSGGAGNGSQLNSQGGGGGGGSYPPNHPLSGSKHLCSICGDRASGKHYGVYSCEGCKGFFKRTVRKDLSYVCREESNCIIDKKQRNRCQYCRYQKCLQMGMKREAVQEERQRTKEKNGGDHENGDSMVESTSSFSMVSAAAAASVVAAAAIVNNNTNINNSSTNINNNNNLSQQQTLNHHHQQQQQQHQLPNPVLATRNDSSALSSLNQQQLNLSSPNFLTSYNHDLLLQQIFEAEKRIEIQIKQECLVVNLNDAVQQQVVQLFEWAKMIPHFADLALEDQCSLIKEGWNELLIAEFAHRSIDASSVLVLGNGFYINEQAAKSTGIGEIFQRVLTELVSKMREMHMDKTELGCLRAVVLFNPELKNLKCGNLVEQYRDKVYASLEEHCKSKYLNQPGRFAKLLLRLPALRSIGLKCVEHLFFKQVGSNILLSDGKKDTIDSYIRKHLDSLAINNNIGGRPGGGGGLI